MKLIGNKKVFEIKGQSLLEYAMVASIVAAAIVAMSTYVYRSVQSTQQEIMDEFQK